jgi:uncharacterized protein (TIGR03437 family)
MLLNLKTAITTALCAATFSLSGLAQVAPPTILKIDTDIGVRYIYDTADLSTFATVLTPLTQIRPTFATQVLLADIVAVNGRPAKGIFMTRQTILNLTTDPTAGQAIADVVRTNVVERILEILQPDGTPIGSLMTLGFDGGSPPPGAPLIAGGSNYAITGGTGAFLGVRGQLNGAGTPSNRNATVREDPAKRRVNGGGQGVYYAHLIPMSRPEILTTAGGPVIVHSSDFSLVTASKPAALNEILSLIATGLGPTRPGVDPGRPFPATPPATVNSPVEVTVNGKSADIIGAVGYPGAVDGYLVNFRVPSDAAHGVATIQLTAAWIAGSPVNIPIQ